MYIGGTGQLIGRLEQDDIDIAMCVQNPRRTFLHHLITSLSALTDPLISGIAKGSTAYKLVGSYVSTPLNWHAALRFTSSCFPRSTAVYRAVITGKDTKYKSIADLKGTTIGISRYGRYAL